MKAYWGTSLLLCLIVGGCRPQTDSGDTPEQSEDLATTEVNDEGERLSAIELRLRASSEAQLRVLVREGDDALEVALAAYLLHDDEAFVDNVTHLTERSPQAQSTLLMQALAHGINGEHREALSLVRQVLRENDDPWIAYHAGSLYLSAGLFPDAANLAAEAINLAADSPRPIYEAYHLRATALRRQGIYDEAVLAATDALRFATSDQSPQVFPYQHQLARLLAVTGHPEDAIVTFARTIDTADAIARGDKPRPLGASARSVELLAAQAASLAGRTILAAQHPPEEALPFFTQAVERLKAIEADAHMIQAEVVSTTLALEVWGFADDAATFWETHHVEGGAGGEAALWCFAFMGKWAQVLPLLETDDNNTTPPIFDLERLSVLLRDTPCETVDISPETAMIDCDAPLDTLTRLMSCALRASAFPELATLAGEAVRCPGRPDSEQTLFGWYLQFGVDMELQRASLRTQFADVASGP